MQITLILRIVLRNKCDCIIRRVLDLHLHSSFNVVKMAMTLSSISQAQGDARSPRVRESFFLHADLVRNNSNDNNGYCLLALSHRAGAICVVCALTQVFSRKPERQDPGVLYRMRKLRSRNIQKLSKVYS